MVAVITHCYQGDTYQGSGHPEPLILGRGFLLVCFQLVSRDHDENGGTKRCVSQHGHCIALGFTGHLYTINLGMECAVHGQLIDNAGPGCGD
ncbi:hypothetical protein DPMN_064209 [Dreissena polymorpha]|uniref:Uncharacterized protein n=1 Tax=Dreissena polymorpha TaxID=45954 RepID=A0A9D4CD85_DREPO|nr:hypothetical protein DPMN_064209 [Dreissena polymorpha]